MRIADIFLSLTGSGLLLALTITMVRRRLHREYPFFLSYILSTLVFAILVLVVSGNDKVYFYSYWILDGFSTVFALLAMNEVFYQVFSGFYSFWWFRWIFPVAVTVMSLIAIRQAFLKPFGPAPTFAWIILSVESAVSFVQAGIALAFLVLALGLRVHWRRYPFYIALGFAVSGAGEWVFHLLLSKFGNKHLLITQRVPPATYLCATLIWLGSFSGKFIPQPELKWDTAASRRDADSTPKLKIV